jgi:ABC-type sugar transport system permease subunit
VRRARREAAELHAAPGELRTALALGSPALIVVVLVGAFPLLWTVWTSLHRHDLRVPGSGSAFVGLANYAEALGAPRFREALAHTATFTGVTVALELLLGLALALALDKSFRGRGLARAAVLLPWALPTVVAALVWRFLFEGSPTGLANAVLVGTGVRDGPLVWLGDPLGAWVPLVLADVWKTTPFVTLLLLAGLQTIDAEVLEAARIDGAGALQRLRHVVLPLLRPTLIVVLLFRTLDAVRVFDLVYALTGGGPGTATEPLALYAFDALLGNLRFGYGSALATLVFALAFALALVYLRVLGRAAGRGRP